MSASHRILAVVSDHSLFRKLDELFRRASLQVHRAPSGAGALILVGNRRYDLIVVEAPLPDLKLEDMLGSLRTLDSACGTSAVVILAPEEHVPPLAKALEGELAGVIAKTAGDQAVQSLVSRILGVAVRTSTRILVQVDVELAEGRTTRIFQTHNLSESGMLLRAALCPDRGARVRLSFALPEDSRPIVTEAEVVRHARDEAEGVRGFAVRFEGMRAEDRDRLHDFVSIDFANAKARDEGAARAEAASVGT